MTLNEHITQETDTWEKASALYKLQTTRRKTSTHDDYTRNLIITGGYIAQFFPDILRFQPRSTEGENDVEYAPLICLLTLLADDQEYLNKVKERMQEAFK